VGPELETAVGAVGPDHEENRAFLSFSRSLRKAGLPVPEIYHADEAAGLWVMEDLGDTTLFDFLVQARDREGQPFPPSAARLYERVLEELPRFQVLGGRAVDFKVAYPRKAFDRQSIAWDLNYFKYHFLKLAHVPFSEARLERDFRVLTRFLMTAGTGHFLYRDFQSRNVMVRDDGPWFIDYQGGRRGALQYDVASLLYDAKANLSPETRGRLLEHYLGALAEYVDFERPTFLALFRGFVLVRIMQALGAYGYRGFFEKKTRFLQSVPFAAKNLERLLEEGLPVNVPELEATFRHIAEHWGQREGERSAAQGLTVWVGSFSYRTGYPADPGGHGGGYVFDCRAIPNPGRLAEYADRTGHDERVIDYIRNTAEAESFWRNVKALVDGQVEEYLRRGFQSLSVSFGCTGGQHRSVYFAERLARHLRSTHPAVTVRVEHRERAAWPAPPAASAGEEAGTVGSKPAAASRRVAR
jgi:aminoglycoside/choline kinase family phosphotransferase